MTMTTSRVDIARQGRRARMHEAAKTEILQAGRRQIAAGGISAVSLRGIASEIGMTAPGIYRYFAKLDDVLVALAEQVDHELAQEAIAELSDLQATANELAREIDPETVAKVNKDFDAATIRVLQRWATEKPGEWSLLFATPGSPGSTRVLRILQDVHG